MTPRRSFFKSIALIGAAAVGCPSVFIPKFEAVRWKRPIGVITQEHLNELRFDSKMFYGKWLWVAESETIKPFVISYLKDANGRIYIPDSSGDRVAVSRW